MKRILAIAIALLFVAGAAYAEGFENISRTTGLQTDTPYKPLVVVFDNDPSARPQGGMSKADVIYEAEYWNGGYSRYVAVFNDVIPETVIAVRSARIFHVDIYLEWGGAFIHHGGQPEPETNLNDYADKMITDARYNGNGKGSGFFYRDSKRKAPYDSVARLREIYDDMTMEITPRGPLTFSAENPTIRGEEANELTISYRKNFIPSYQYNADEGLYYRYYNGKPQKDAYDDALYTGSNVIVMNANYSWFAGDDKRPVVDLTGSNVCEYFIGGRHFTGTWQRDSVTANTLYLDDEGNEVLLRPGRTFIHLIKDAKMLSVG